MSQFNLQAALRALFSTSPGNPTPAPAFNPGTMTLPWPTTVQQYLADSNGTNRLILNPVAKTIVDGSATSLFNVACPASAFGSGVIFYNVEATDGTDFQSLTGMVTYSCVNKAGTLTLAITEATANQAKAVSSGTLTLAWTFVTGASLGTVKLTPTGSLTETSYTVTYTVFPIAGTVTIL